MPQRNRISWIDTAKGIGIWLMLLSHASLGPQSPLAQFIFAFHMPLFFFLYGIQMPRERAGDKKLSIVLTKGFCAYIVPYFLFALLIDGAHLDRHLTLRRVALILYGTHASRNESVSLGALWFLPCFYLASLGYHAWCKWLHGQKNKRYCVLSFIAVIALAGVAWRFRNGTALYDLPWDINVACGGMAFMLIGSMLRPLLLCAAGCKRWQALLAGLALWAVMGWSNLYNVRLIQAQGFYFVNMGESIYGNMAFYILNACLGSIGLLAISYAVDCTFWQFVGSRTIGILVLQLMADRFVRRMPVSLWLDYPWKNVAIATGNLFVSLLFTCIILWVCPPILGKPPRRSKKND